MARKESAPFLLQDLPDCCMELILLKMQQSDTPDDQSSLFSLSRAHSRLHQATAAAIRSIKADLSVQQQVDGVMRYLGQHNSHVSSITLVQHIPFTRQGSCTSLAPYLKQLPPNLRLSSLRMEGLLVQLRPSHRPMADHDDFQGVFGAAEQAAGMKQLRLKDCKLGDWLSDVGNRLAAALLQMLRLEKLSISDCHRFTQLPTVVLQKLQQLTYLELENIRLQGPGSASPALQPLQVLTQLVDLRLADAEANDNRILITGSMLSGTHHLTCLMLSRCSIEPGVLDGKTQLQRLHLFKRSLVGGVSGATAHTRTAQLLSLLQGLQQLQHLQVSHMNLAQGVQGAGPANPPAAAAAAAVALSALTASSKLQHLDISWCTLPAGVWQHVFQPGRQRLHLQHLDISHVVQPFYSQAAVLVGSLLTSCCPGLQLLDIRGLQYSAEQLAPLQGLGGLHTLSVAVDASTAREGVQEVCQLTWLRQLRVSLPRLADVVGLQELTQLAQLQQLTALIFDGPWAVTGCQEKIILTSQAPDDEPVWLQLLRL